MHKTDNSGGRPFTKEAAILKKISQKYQHDHNLRHGFPDASASIFCVNCRRGFAARIGLTKLSPTSKAHGRNPTLMSSLDVMDSNEREGERDLG